MDLSLKDLPAFGSKVTCQYHGIAVQCGPRGLKGSPDNLYHNNGDGTFSDVSKTSRRGRFSKSFFGLTSGVVALQQRRDNLDLFVANDGEPNYLYRNEGNGHFTDVALQAGVSGQSWMEANRPTWELPWATTSTQGLFSLAITHFSEEYAALFRNDGALSFTGCFLLNRASPARPRPTLDGETPSSIWTTMDGPT